MVEKILENKIYNVRPGDTLLRIAQMTGVAYADLVAMNPQIANPNLIHPGDSLVLPDTVSRQKLIVDASEATYPGGEPLWLKIARHEIGVAEKDPGNNPRILEYLATTTLDAGAKQTDATAWCSAFANWAIRMAGVKGTNSAWALDWKSWGKAVDPPKPGAVVVFSRQSRNVSGGHVGFYLDDSASKVTILGGNQGNKVSISDFPKNGVKEPFKYVLQGYRWPS